MLPLPPDDLGPLADAARVGLGAFPGCSRFALAVTQVNRAAGLRTESALSIEGVLRDGTWEVLRTTEATRGDQGIVVGTQTAGGGLDWLGPFFGELVGAEDESRALFEQVLDRASVPVEVEYVTTDTLDGAPAWRYRRSLGSGWSLLGGTQENTLLVWIEPEPLRARRWSLVIEDPVRLGDGAGRIAALDLAMETDPAGWPRAERLRTRFAVGPLSLRVERDIAYTRLGDC